MEFFSTSNGIPVHISDSGSGEKVILFLHGYLETLYIWEEFVDLLPKCYRTIAIDIPGHGLTSSHPVCNDMKFCADVVVGVLNRLQINKCIVVGHSMGGYIAQSCIKYYPSLFSALFHFNSNPYSDNPDKKSDRLKEIDFILSGKLMSLASIAIPNMFSQQNLRRMDYKIQETIEICETHDPSGIAASVRGLIEREDNVQFLNSSNIPLYFIFGTEDRYLPVDNANKILLDLPSAKGFFIESTGHSSFLEEPHKVLDILLSEIK